MAAGTIKQYSEERGFGFVTPDAGGPDVFFHISAWKSIGKVPTRGDNVSFEETTNPRTGRP